MSARASALGGCLLLLSALTACNGSDNSGSQGDATQASDQRRQLLRHLSDAVFLPGYQAFAQAARQLAEVNQRYEQALGAAGADAERDAARQAWRAAMALWQRAELWQFGPAGGSESYVGGQGLRDQLYSWPTVSPCRIDQELIALADRTDSPSFAGKLVNVYGLDALEYLLFNERAETACPAQLESHQQAWQGLSASERQQLRAGYARAVSRKLSADAQALAEAWASTGGAFAVKLASAGQSGSPFSSAQAALDQIFAAMFYLDQMVKDRKLARPTGISGDCSAAVCPDLLESAWAAHSRQNLLANLRGLAGLIDGAGDAARGFAWLLRQFGAESLAAQLSREVAAAVSRAESLADPLRETLLADSQSVRALHAAVKTITDTLKSEFITVLNLRVPDEGAGDND